MVLLDLMLPGKRGVELLKEIGERYGYPVIVISAQGERELATTEFEVTSNGVIRLYSHLNRPAAVSSAPVAAGLELEQFMPMGEDLESYFTSRIGGGEYA